MLALKLLLVPLFLMLISMAGRRWGPAIAGWLAGLPVVTGPILFFLSIEHGKAFGANAASASLAAVFASVSFSLTYSHVAQRMGWLPSLFAGLSSWAVAAFLLFQIPASTAISLVISLSTLLVALRLFPLLPLQPAVRLASMTELGCRMLAGALLTVLVTLVASIVGQTWSGLLAVFPILGIVLAVFSHRIQGVVYAAALLRAMATGLYSFVAFCFTVSITLTHFGIAAAFSAAIVAAIMVQLVTKRRLAIPSSVLSPAR